MMLSRAVRNLPGVCWGQWNGHACPVSLTRHRKGVLDGYGLIHFADRRFTRRAAKNLLLLVAARERQRNPEFLNSPMFDWLYVYLDAVAAQRIAMEHGIRLPSRIFAKDRERARAYAERRGAAISRHHGFYQWLRA